MLGSVRAIRAAGWLRRRLWPVSALLGLCLAAALCGAAGRFAASCAAVRQNTLRLHIRAAGDSIACQTEKLWVRDRVLALTEPLYAGVQTAAEAKEAAARSLPRIALAARHALWQRGVRLPVSVCLANEYFRTRTYREYTLPPGRYDALCIRLGSGTGRNWWCCLYPQLCLAACSGYADEQQTVVLGQYRVAFRLAEWWHRLQADPAAEPLQPPVEIRAE